LIGTLLPLENKCIFSSCPRKEPDFLLDVLGGSRFGAKSDRLLSGRIKKAATLLYSQKTCFLFASSRSGAQKIEIRHQLHILLVCQNEELPQVLPTNKCKALPRRANQASTWLIFSAYLRKYQSQHFSGLLTVTICVTSTFAYCPQVQTDSLRVEALVKHWFEQGLYIGTIKNRMTVIRWWAQKVFRWFGKERSQTLKFVCSDMWKPYLKVIAKKAGPALHILDRFHIMSNLSKAIDEVRAQETRELQAKGYEAVLTNTRSLLLKRPENLTYKQETKLMDLLRYNLKSMRSYLLKEEFQLFWQYTSPYWAGEFLDKWRTKTMRSKLEPMKKVAKMLRRHRPLLLNWFQAKKQFSSGIVEGFNTKAKLTTRKAYGFKIFHAVEIALYHALGALPVPKTTHVFF